MTDIKYCTYCGSESFQSRVLLAFGLGLIYVCARCFKRFMVKELPNKGDNVGYKKI